MKRCVVPAEFGFYGILTDPVQGYVRCTEAMVAREVPFVQLRMKDAPAAVVLETAREMRRITQGSGTRLVINDFAGVARDCDADGVHVGQCDLAYQEVRRIVGPDCCVGLSTHSAVQLERACTQEPDYVGIGPVFATPTKKIPDPPLGITGMRSLLRLATVPAVVLGSITLENLPQLYRAGARNVALVRPVNNSDNPGREIDRILDALERCREGEHPSVRKRT